MTNVIVLIGAGSIGQAIARRVSAGKKLLLAQNAALATTPVEDLLGLPFLQPDQVKDTPDEVGNVAALLMGTDGAFITGSDFLMDGGVTAAYWYGDLAPKQEPQ